MAHSLLVTNCVLICLGVSEVSAAQDQADAECNPCVDGPEMHEHNDTLNEVPISVREPTDAEIEAMGLERLEPEDLIEPEDSVDE